MITISVESMCDGLGHWNVSVSDGTQTATIATEWSAIQTPLDADELPRLAMLVLRAKCAGVPINALGDLLLNGVTI